MIRYVLAVVLAVALVGMAFAAADYAGATNGERQVEAQIAEIDDAAVSLVENEELPPPGHPGSQRTVEVSLPEDSLTSTPIEFLRIERVDENVSVATYRVEGRSEHTVHLDAPVVGDAGGAIEFTGSGVETTVRLTLERDPDPDVERPIVVLSRV